MSSVGSEISRRQNDLGANRDGAAQAEPRGAHTRYGVCLISLR